MQVQAVVHVGTGENMMNQMATFCLGEGTLSGMTRCKQLGANN